MRQGERIDDMFRKTDSRIKIPRRRNVSMVDRNKPVLVSETPPDPSFFKKPGKPPPQRGVLCICRTSCQTPFAFKVNCVFHLAPNPPSTL
jgi:hypothetical protein